jgi:hypothetical protein
MHRTIRWSPARARQVALAAAHLGLPDGESFVQASIDASLLSLSEHDPAFKLALARSAGVSWPTLERIVTRTAEDQQS